MLNMTGKKFKCKGCDGISTAEHINKVTIDNCCANRQQRRNYVPIEKTKQTDPKWYQCPVCGQNIRRRGWKKLRRINMVINESEANDFGLTNAIMVSRFKRGKPVFIGKGKYVITDIINNHTGCITYRLMKIRIKED